MADDRMTWPDCTIDRTITIPAHVMARAMHGPIEGTCLLVPVVVNWPELRLTEAQILANAVAMGSGERMPYPDPSIIIIEIPWASPR